MKQFLKVNSINNFCFDICPSFTLLWEYVNNDFVLKRANSESIKRTNKKVLDFIGLTARQIYSDMPLIVEKLFECHNSVKLLEFELDYKTRYSGMNEYVKFRICKINDKEIIMYADILTILKKRESELEQALLKAEESDKLKAAFLNNISHEIRTPMNGILGFASLLRSEDFTLSERDNFVNIIQKSCNRLLNTIEDIIEISKIDSGIVKLNISEVNLNKHLQTLVNFFSLEAQSNDIEIKIEKVISKNLEIVHIDKVKFGVIVSNLIKNSIKFSKAGGQIIIGMSRIDDNIYYNRQNHLLRGWSCLIG